MSKFRIKWNSDKIVSLSAMAISFITLLIFIYQTNLMSRQNYLSIMPYLMVSSSSDGATYTFDLDIVNQGVGPAIIESVSMTYQGKKEDLINFDNRLYDYLLTKMPGLDTVQRFSTAILGPGMAIPANATYNLLAVQDSAGYKAFGAALEKLLQEGLQYEIVYKSIQHERWRITTHSMEPQRVD